ncbi:MAG: dicarboxylate/amino acid:cation symporter [SAR86 cluster bacterium]|uniref:Dicarboxylate/amino acid:cation symporter n=1 Tax=SAR86 cluster bacterium TaxID=2030880 RepID=A0A2A5CJB3_9GAMM|nr:MAG: dicarboxylate/amino acid:cation symporter [SAR86 cluster bacterium]
MKLHWQILIAILLAAVCGQLTGTELSIFGVTFYAMYDFIGTMFLNALRMIIVPLIMASIICGVANMGGRSDLGKMGGMTLAYYAVTSTLAILVGLFYVNLLSPGIIDGVAAGESLNLSLDEGALASAVASVEGRGGGDIAAIFLRMIPTNVVAAAAEGQMLGLIFFSLVFGYFMTQIPNRQGEVLLNFWQGISETMMRITMWIMRFAPYGVFGLVAGTVASTGFAAFQPMLIFFITVLLALATHVFVVMPLLLKYVGGVSPVAHYKAMVPAVLTAFSTASSSATLPLTMECLEKNAGVSEKTTSFVLPLGATVNMDGTALYECVAAIFLAQAYGIELSFATQFTVVLIALLTSIGVAGIPAASLVAITVILTAIGLPVEAIGLLLVTDRILDMCRTSVNIFSDSCGAVIIAKRQGELGILES